MDKNIKEKLYDIVEEQINTALNNLPSIVSTLEPQYKMEWCNDELDSELLRNMLKQKGQYIKLIIDNLLCKCPENMDGNEDEVVEKKDITQEIAKASDFKDVDKAIARNEVEVLVDNVYYYITKQPDEAAITGRLDLIISRLYPDLVKFKE